MLKKNYTSIGLILCSFYVFSNFKSYLSKSNSKKNSKNFMLFSAENFLFLEQQSRSGLEEELYSHINKENETKKFNFSKEEAEIQKIIYQVSDEVHVPAELLASICLVESNLDSKAFRPHDGGPSNHAYGLCQVLRKTGEFVMNHTDEGCTKDYSLVSKSKRSKQECFLFDTYLNVKAAGLYLRKQMDEHKSLEKVIAAYNAGSVKTNPLTEDFINRAYVNKVMTTLQSYGPSIRAERRPREILLTSN